MRPMFTARRFVVLCGVWAVVAWITTTLWALKAQELTIGEALGHHYALRSPIAGALAGGLLFPVFLLFHRLLHLSDTRLWRWPVLLGGGVISGQLAGAFTTVLLLLLWPGDSWNSRMDAFKWSFFFWKIYWYLLAPAGAVAGVVSLMGAKPTPTLPTE